MLAWVLGRPMAIKPLIISKINTFSQILLAGVVLGVLGLEVTATRWIELGSYVVAGLTVISGALYLRDWLVYVANGTIKVRQPGDSDP